MKLTPQQMQAAIQRASENIKTHHAVWKDRGKTQIRKGDPYPNFNRIRDPIIILDDLEDDNELNLFGNELEAAHGACSRCGRSSLVRVPQKALLIIGSIDTACVWCDWERMKAICGWRFIAHIRKHRNLMSTIWRDTP